MYVIVHTMTIKERDYVVQAQYFHALHAPTNATVHSRLVARKVSVRLINNRRFMYSDCLQGLASKNKSYEPPCLRKALMKRDSASVKHSLRTFHVFSPRNGSQSVVNAAPIVPKLTTPESKPISCPNLNNSTIINAEKSNSEQTLTNNARQDIDKIAPVLQHLTANADPSQASKWLVVNRFERYLASFGNFSGADLLRMSRDDLIQVCGQADGIRLYNALHSKTIAPALTIYVARSRAAPYHAIYLRNFSTNELQAKLSAVMSLATDCISAIYVQGPQGIRVHLEDTVLRHIRDESMFSVAILHANNNNNGNADVIVVDKLAILLKPESIGVSNVNIKDNSFDDMN